MISALFDGEARSFPTNAGATYSANQYAVSTRIGGESVDEELLINLSGAGVGEIPCRNSIANPTFISLRNKAAAATEAFDTQYDQSSGSACTVKVTEYGNPGQRVAGSFSGTLMNAAGDTLIITDGRFDVTRLPDQ